MKISRQPETHQMAMMLPAHDCCCFSCRKPIQQKKAPVVAGETSIYASAAGKAQQSSSSGKAAQVGAALARTVWTNTGVSRSQ